MRSIPVGLLANFENGKLLLHRSLFWLKRFHRLARQHGKFAVASVVGDGLEGGKGRPYVPPDYEKEDKDLQMLTSCPWPIHAALTKKSAIEAAGGFDERYRNAEDYGLWLRVAQGRITLVPEVLAFYHFHDGVQATKNRARAAREHWLVQREFLEARPEVAERLGRALVRKLTDGGLLKKGYVCYWDRDLESAREIFRIVMKTGYGAFSDWKYMLPSILPLNVHRLMMKTFEKREKGL